MIETVLIADTQAIGRTLANELGLSRRTTQIVSKPDHLRGCNLNLDVRVIDRAQHMPQQTQRAIEDNLVLCGATEVLTLDLEPDFIEQDGTLRLDTAGQYRYRYVRAQDDHTHIYERITR